ncbi:MAG: hypothetical protein HY342_10150 [Candidatus Lambdaproteobacteria bacterium]|nr:hypothetical protein [Candidatus Lambdaproteobacteria bacterium]
MMPITNALENARRLESLGFTHEQAQGLSEIVEQAALASQPDFSKPQVQLDMQTLRSEMRAMGDRLVWEIRTQTLSVFTMLVGLLGLTIAILKFLP